MKNQQQITRRRISMGFVVRVQTRFISLVAVAVLLLGSGDWASLSA